MRENTRIPVLSDRSGANFIENVDKAEALSARFSSVFTCTRTDSCPNICGVVRPQHQCTSIHFYPSQVFKLTKSKPSLKETYDGILHIVYNKCASTLSVPLTHVFIVSMLMGEFPELWKGALVTAIPKISVTKLVCSFLPISPLSAPAKVMERVVGKKLKCWLERFSAIPKEQHSFVFLPLLPQLLRTLLTV